ncbi:hypothetical protein BC829DRAFT_242199 [Chytridium lagenaria]|nr:hypothetical protein BC829DRAFT_242199 [Chytridium lagenaria]
MMQDFVVKFFKLFDTHRAGLMDLYSDNAVFSLSINPSPRRTGPNPSRPLNVHGWLPFNRNHHEKSTGAGKGDLILLLFVLYGKESDIQLCRVHCHLCDIDVSKRASMLSMGPQQIIQTFSKLPTTLHRDKFQPRKEIICRGCFPTSDEFWCCCGGDCIWRLFHEETNVNHSFTEHSHLYQHHQGHGLQCRVGLTPFSTINSFSEDGCSTRSG